jgi:hypothetical protein
MLSFVERVIWKPEELGTLAVHVVDGDRVFSRKDGKRDGAKSDCERPATLEGGSEG